MKYSIVIPMYNSENTISDAIKSILEQTYIEPIEIVIVNDGSTDNSVEVVNQLIMINNTNRVIKLINKLNGGVSSARNIGIKEALGEWISLLDSDDIWVSEKLTKQIEEIEKNPEIKFIGSNKDNERYKFNNKSQFRLYNLNTKDLLLKMWPYTSTAMIHKDVFKYSGFYDESKTHAEDGDLWLKISQHFNLFVLNEDLVFTKIRKRNFGESGLSANLKKMQEGQIRALKDAKARKQINVFEFVKFYLWYHIKYYRRIAIVRLLK